MNDADKIKNFLEKETQHTIKSEKENLIDSGILDSFSMIKLLNFIETELGTHPNMEELTSRNFDTTETISDMVRRWKQHGNKTD